MCLNRFIVRHVGVSVLTVSVRFSGCFCPPNPKANVERNYGSPEGEETAVAIRETADGGFILAGYQNFYNQREYDGARPGQLLYAEWSGGLRPVLQGRLSIH